MTLPALLSELAALLPERVKVDWGTTLKSLGAWVHMNAGQWQLVGITAEEYQNLPSPLGAVWLEMALREECEARGWVWNLCAESGAAGYVARVQLKPRGKVYACSVIAKLTPAEALAAAVLAALKAEKGKG